MDVVVLTLSDPTFGETSLGNSASHGVRPC
jgi:hypothetical protein